MINKQIKKVLFAACLSGYYGPYCSYMCPYPYFGQYCSEGQCQCPKENCDAKTGCRTSKNINMCLH